MTAEEFDDDAFRALLATWASGVSVITAVRDGVHHGCTVSAFSALSLRPRLVLVCLDLESNTLAAVRDSGRFAVNLLAEHQHRISDHFAVKAEDDDKFLSAGHRLVEGQPVLDGCLAYLICDLRQEVPGGDHAILIGSPVDGAADHGLRPLVHFRRAYHAIGRE
jgi:flavin reductase (DIM6/NTAB) family NADH-FMN oxidoreductase RutF